MRPHIHNSVFLSIFVLQMSFDTTRQTELHIKMNINRLIIRSASTIMMAASTFASAQALQWNRGQDISLVCDTSKAEPVVRSAARMLEADMQQTLGARMHFCSNAKQLRKTEAKAAKSKAYAIVTYEDAGALNNKKEAFQLKVKGNAIILTGSDAHGIAYGLLEISRLLGVSPWTWWADATPDTINELKLDDRYHIEQAPSVEFRGIFINDEDWGLMPWASKTYEPTNVKGQIGPKSNARIFELLLRLRANTYWPAMHECTHPFFLTEGNRNVAKQYGIYIGGSHCEPMASSTAGEWPARGKGEYDYVNNKDNVYHFWEDRVKEVAGQHILYTLGMRGVHDGAMKGARTVGEQKAVLEKAIGDQRHMLSQYVNSDITKVPQVFIPYKEVLDVYNAGLKVPDDVCLMWCDDNYGYVRHYPTEEERLRKGGNGIYYHVSYWGRPHDYLWLGTFSPSLMFQQMSAAWHKGIQRYWILNVGDIKPAEYQIELFLDMAWNMRNIYPNDNAASAMNPNNEWLAQHMHNFYAREFGNSMADQVTGIMKEHYRLAFICKPEFLGNTRCEERDRSYTIVKDMPWSESMIRERLSSYEAIANKAHSLAKDVAQWKRDAFYQLVEYPVVAASQMNVKMLAGQLARHGKESWERSDAAFDSIAKLTATYNKGKWNRIMNYQPRKQPVFAPLAHETSDKDMMADIRYAACFNATDCTDGHPFAWDGLGYNGKAAEIRQGKTLTYMFKHENASATDSATVEVCFIPSHPIKDSRLGFNISVDGGNVATGEYQTKGRSEEWKVNVLTNHATRVFTQPMHKGNAHTIAITALDEGVILDQIKVCIASKQN